MINRIIKVEEFDFDNILIDENSHKNILTYDISCKTLFGLKPLCIKFNKINGFIRIYDGTRYFTLFGSEKYDTIYNRIGYLNSITYIFYYYYAKVESWFFWFFTYRKSIDFA